MTTTLPHIQEIHILSHTHWDREWYKPFQGFRHYLVKVIDDVLDRLESDPDYRYFHLDGQTIILEDYAEIRPERINELKKRLQEGKIFAGPWFVSPDLFTVDGECLVRNIQLGFEICREWGTTPLLNGYAVDNFGYNSQMPQIYDGFGIDTSILFRGTNRYAAGSLFKWIGADKTECLVFRLSDDTAYSNFWYAFKPFLTQNEDYDEKKSAEILDRLIEITAAETPIPILLFMDGVDHVTANPLTTRILADARGFHPEINFLHSSLNEFIKQTKSALAADPSIDLPNLTGELRIPNKDGLLNRFTTDVSSSRIYLKTSNKECEIRLLRWFEPFRAAAATIGVFHPEGFVKRAWKYLITNHPHDSICGCSVDPVHQDMEYRFRQSRFISEVSTNYILNEITRRINTSSIPGESGRIIVFSPFQKKHKGIIFLEFDVPEMAQLPAFNLKKADGIELNFQLLESKEFRNRVGYDPIKAAHGDFKGKYVRIAVDMNDVPSVGYITLQLQSIQNAMAKQQEMISDEHAVMENPYLRVEIRPDGLIDLYHKESATLYQGLHNYEDCGEVGDLWVHMKPSCDCPVKGFKSANTSLLQNGPLVATYRVEYILSLPSHATHDRTSRSDQYIEQKIVSDFTLTASSRFLKVKTHMNNCVKDHRLRVIFPSGIQTDYHYAASEFDVVRRKIQLPDTRDWREPASETNPNQGFVDLNDGRNGLCILNRGLVEYAVYDDPQRTIALTLVRSVAAIVGVDGEGEGQCLRELEYEYGIYPHKGSWEEADVYDCLEEMNLECIAKRVDNHLGDLPTEKSFFELSPENLVLSSIRNPAGCDNDVVIRLYNPTEKDIEGSISIGFPVEKASFCNLNDESFESIHVKDNSIDLLVESKKIVSIRLRCCRGPENTLTW